MKYYFGLGTIRWLVSSSSSSSSSKQYNVSLLHSSPGNNRLRSFSTTALLLLDSSRHGLDPTLNRFHAPMVYHENYSFADWPPHHTFPMDKFAQLQKVVLTKLAHLPRALVQDKSHLYRALDYRQIPIDEWLAEPNGPIDPDFLKRFVHAKLSTEEKRMIGFREQTDRPELIERTILEVAGTVLACQLAYQYGIASNLAGGTHHAHRTMGAGYTIINDLAVAANYLTSPTLSPQFDRIQKVLVIDCDVHQGDGTAKFEALHNQGRMVTLSLHCASNYPRPKAQSTIDVGLLDNLQDDDYMNILETTVNQAIVDHNPDFVLYDAGVDIYEHDKLGRLKVTEDGIRRRDRFVVETCVQANIPIAAVIGGGYDRDVVALARRHAIVHEECAYVWRKYQLWKRALDSGTSNNDRISRGDKS